MRLVLSLVHTRFVSGIPPRDPRQNEARIRVFDHDDTEGCLTMKIVKFCFMWYSNRQREMGSGYDPERVFEESMDLWTLLKLILEDDMSGTYANRIL